MKQAGQTSKVRLQVQKHQSLFNFEGFVDFVDTDGDQLNLQTVANGKETCPTERRQYGGIAQLGERLLCKQEVNGSIPFISTSRLSLRRIPKWEQAKRPSGCFDRLTA